MVSASKELISDQYEPEKYPGRALRAECPGGRPFLTGHFCGLAMRATHLISGSRS